MEAIQDIKCKTDTEEFFQRILRWTDVQLE